MRSLAVAGVGVYEAPGDTAPLQPLGANFSPLRLTSWQARNLAIELDAEAGFSGSELDDLAGLADDSLPLSYLLAGWLLEHDSAPAREARRLVGDRLPDQPEAAVFPGIVLTLFVADAAAQASAGRPAVMFAVARPAARPQVISAAQAAGPCGPVAAWFEGQIDALFNALLASSDAWYSDVWNAAVSIFGWLIKKPISLAIDAVLAPIKAVLGVIGVLIHAANFLTTWSVKLAAEPAGNEFSVGAAAPNVGLVRVSVDSGLQADWPAWLIECASAINVSLPTTAAAGGPVKWSTNLIGRPDLAVHTSALQTTVDGSEQSELSYRAGSEPTAEGAVATGHYVVRANVERMAVTELKKLLEATLFGLLPGVAGEIVNPIINAQVQPRLDKLAALADLKGIRAVPITYHTQPEATSPPQPLPPVDACPGTPLRPGRWRGTFEHKHTATYTAGDATGKSTGTQKGTVELIVSCAGSVTGHLHSPEFDQPTQIITPDMFGNSFTTTIDCSGTDVRHTLSGGTVSTQPSGMPLFELMYKTAFGSYGCEGSSIPLGDGSGSMVMRASSQHDEAVSGSGAAALEFAGSIVPSVATEGLQTSQSGQWALSYEGEN